MKFQGIVLLCCVLLVKGQASGNSKSDSDETTTTPASTTSTSTSTTTATTTTTKEPETTTPPPKTTSTPATTAKPSPAPVVPDYPKNIGKWSVEDPNNSSCITLKGAMQIVVVINENKTETVNVPPFAQASGICKGKDEQQTITLSWNSTAIPDLENSLSLTFESNATKENAVEVDSGITVGKYGLQDVQAILFLDSGNSTVNVQKIADFQTPFNHSYSCLAEEVIKSNNGTLMLKVREIQVEAFRLTPAGHREFSAAVQCPADDATDVVPIAVGAALAGLVVIVLIAYLIGRKRSRARGYQSV